MPRHRRQRQPMKTYVVIFVVCGALALLMHLISDVSTDVQKYANEGVNSAVRKAVESELKKTTK